MTSMSLNCNHGSGPVTGMLLNCRTAQTSCNMPVRHLEHWTYCRNPHYIILRHLRQLRHPSHLSHLSHLSNISDLDSLDPSSLDPTPTDSLPGAFITEMDPMDPGSSEGCYVDNSDPPHIETPLYQNHYTNQIWTPPGSRTNTSQIDALNGHSPISGIPIDALDGHDSI
jgi:hypothetical protein